MNGHQVSWSIGPMLLGYLASGFVSAVSLVLYVTGGVSGFIVPMALYGTLIVLMAGLPGFAIALAAARHFKWQSWFHFGLAGGLNALLAILVYYQRFPDSLSMVTSYFGAGFVGGLCYWAVVRWFLLRREADPAAV